MHYFVFFMLLCLNSRAIALNWDGTIPIDLKSEENAIPRALTLLSSDNHEPPPTIPPQSFQSKKYAPIKLEGGLQLHPSCALEASRRGLKVAEFKKVMNAMMARMLDRVVRCNKEYPELSGYLKEVIGQYRLQIIRCEPPLNKKGLIEIVNEKFGAYHNRESGITVSANKLDAAFDETGRDDFISTIFHELLHGTHANNHSSSDHSRLESIKARDDEKNMACKDDATLDRVSVIESLCMGTPLNASNKTASVLLTNRMNKCGPDRGCRDVFTARGNSIGLYNKFSEGSLSRDLNDSYATSLCQRIKDDGMCLNFRNDQGMVLTFSNPKLSVIRKKLGERLQEVLPRSSNKFSTELIELYPDLNRRFQVVTSRSCFKRHFYISESEPKEINALRTKGGHLPLEKWGHQKVSAHLQRIKMDFKSRYGPCEKDGKEIEDILTKLVLNLSSLDTELQMITKQYVTKDYEMAVFHKVHERIVKLLGEDLLSDYVRAFDMLHFSSPYFDCRAAGLAPFRSMETALKKSSL